MPTLPHLPPKLRDARIWQIAALGTLLAYGSLVLGFDQAPQNVAIIVAGALATQWLGQRLAAGMPGYAAGTAALKPFDPLSPLITALSLSILLRANSAWWLLLAAVLAIGSKLVLRFDGRHVFNPANFAIAVLLLCSECAWISPAQWGSRTWAVFLFASLACLVLSQARRTDIALAFLAAYGSILLARALWLGDPLAIPLKQMQSGALLLFAFFMISDPRTTPDRRSARILYAVLVAGLGAWLQLWHWKPEGLIYALFFASPLVPVLDRLMPRVAGAPRFEWARPV